MMKLVATVASMVFLSLVLVACDNSGKSQVAPPVSMTNELRAAGLEPSPARGGIPDDGAKPVAPARGGVPDDGVRPVAPARGGVPDDGVRPVAPARGGVPDDGVKPVAPARGETNDDRVRPTRPNAAAPAIKR